MLCGLVLLDVMACTRGRMQAYLATRSDYNGNPGIFDAWFIDDGQVVIAPELVDPFLRIMDDELTKVGATRGQGTDVKSVARIVGSAEAVAAVDAGWCTDYVHLTCRVPDAGAAPRVLGIDLGDSAVATAQFREVAAAAGGVQDAIGSIGDSAVELVLTRRCADVCKVTHLLRAHGPSIQTEALDEFDDRVRVALARSLGTSLRHEASLKAALGVKDGGLGLRRAADVAAPAYVASRVLARPMVMDLAGALEREGLASFKASFDEVIAALRDKAS